ncbi:ABC transporter transmembrane domain-containing protein [Desulforapulum autotrophicum]|uniref:ABC transporter transmembrane domain-containing protein n=1 Tax=Desulforapulum autotrophicum TaxID=2296 RepID=UPI0038BCD38C
MKIQSFSLGNLDNLKTGELMVRLSSDTSAVQRLVLISLRIGTRAPLIMVGSLILMVNTSLGLALTMVPLLMMSRLSNVWANGMASSKWIYGLISTWFPGFTRSTTAGSPLTKQIS